MDTDISFAQSLQHITLEQPLVPALLYGLSLMTKEELIEFESAWLNIESKGRRAIMQHLVDIAEQNFEVFFDPIFILALKDPDSEVQALAIGGLWENKSPALVTSFIHLLKQGQNSRVRAAAAAALGRYIYLGELDKIDSAALMAAEQALLRSIRQVDEDIEVIRRAIEAISFSAREGVDQIIENAYYHEDERMRASALFSMGRSYNARWGGIVLAELDSINPLIRYEAVGACGELELKEAVDKLIDLIDREADASILQSAIWSLGQIGGYRAQETLKRLSESSDEVMRTAAENAMNELLLFSGDMTGFFDFPLPEVDLDEDEDDDDPFFDLDEDDYQIYNLN